VVNNCATFLSFCYVYSNTGDGVRMEASFGNARGPLDLFRCIFYANTGKGAYNVGNGGTHADLDQNTIVRHCAFVSNTGDGLQINVTGNNGLVDVTIESSIFYGNGGYGANVVVLYGFLLGGNNAYGANTTAAYGGALTAQPGDVTLTGDPFNGRTTNDFSLNNTAGAGAACRNAGFPGTMQAGGTGYCSIGPFEPQAAGASTTIIVPSITRNLYVGREE